MNEVNRWQEAISSLPDKQFFNTMRLYLGEIKTPYNKQRLIEQLAQFLHQEKNISAILTLLDELDVKVLTAISLIPKSTQDVLVDFFSTSYTFSELYSEIVNLKDRQLIFGEVQEYTQKEYLFINPLLKEKLQDYLNINLILQDSQVTFYSMEDIFQLTPNFIASFISYIKVRGIACKADGIIKKNDKVRLAEIFPNRDNCIQLLMNAFINLSLVREGTKNFSIDSARLQAFAQLGEEQQVALLCAASVSRFSKEGLKKEAQLLLDCLSSIPETGYTRETILRLAFLIGTYTEDGSAIAKKSRFSQMLEAARNSAEADDPQQNANLLDRMIDSAIEFGLLKVLGKDENSNVIYVSAVETQSPIPQDVQPKVLNLDSTFTVTLMPGLNLKNLLPFTSFLMIKKSAVVTEFEITKQSASASFDEGWTPDSIFELMARYSAYEIPNNLKVNISEWYTSYSSAMLYHGYILKVADSNITFAENNPNIKKYIKEKLTDGIYLLNIPATADISAFMDESGLDFLGNIKQASSDTEFSNYPLLRPGKSLKMTDTTKQYQNISIASADKLLKQLREVLASKDYDANKKESLEHRIANRLILTETQLETAAIRTEILEAEGMDFSGKVHLIEAACKEEDMMEFQLPTPNGDGNFLTLVGKPLLVSKQPGEAICRVQIEPTHNIETILVSRITHLRRLRF